MGWGNLDDHISQGGAQIFSHNPAIGELANTFQQYQQKRLEDNKFLNDQLATNYDPGALRNDADKTEYLKRYNDIKNSAIEAENEKNQQKRALAISEIRQRIGGLNAWGEGSKKQALLDRQLGTEFMKNPDHYEDDSVDKYKAGLQKLWDDPGVVNNASQIERRVDPDKMDAEYRKFRQPFVEQSQWDNGVMKGVRQFDGKTYGTLVQNRGLPIDGDNGAYEQTLHYATATPNFKKGLKDRYPDINTGNPQLDLGLRVRKYMHDMGDQQGFYDKPKERELTGETPQRWTLAQLWNFKHYGTPNSPTAASANAPTYEQDLSGRLADPKKQDEAIAELNTAAITNPAFKHNITVHKDLQNGTTEVVIPPKYRFDKKAQADYDKTVGTEDANGNIIKPNPNAGRLKIQDEQHYVLDPRNPQEHDERVKELYNYIDDKGAASKALTFAGKGHVIGSKGGLSEQAKGQTFKTIPSTTIKSLVGKKGYEGYTEQELIDYYKKQGYTIK